jgi:hypothetical protein
MLKMRLFGLRYDVEEVSRGERRLRGLIFRACWVSGSLAVFVIATRIALLVEIDWSKLLLWCVLSFNESSRDAVEKHLFVGQPFQPCYYYNTGIGHNRCSALFGIIAMGKRQQQ